MNYGRYAFDAMDREFVARLDRVLSITNRSIKMNTYEVWSDGRYLGVVLGRAEREAREQAAYTFGCDEAEWTTLQAEGESSKVIRPGADLELVLVAEGAS